MFNNIFSRTHILCYISIFIVLLFAIGFPSKSSFNIKLLNGSFERYDDSAQYETSYVELKIQPRGLQETIEVHFQAKNFEPIVTLKDIPHTYNCYKNKNNISDCFVNFSFSDMATPLTIDSLNPENKFLIVSAISTREKGLTPLNSLNFNNIILLILCALPIAWATYSNKVVNQWFLVTISLLILAELQLYFTLLLVFFLYCSYFAGVSSKVPVKKFQKPFFFIITSFLFFLLYKIVITHFSFAFDRLTGLTLIAPLGASYFAIRLIDTQLRWYRGDLKNVTFREFLLFIIFPPTLAAGPIETLDQFVQKKLEAITGRDILIGLSRIIIGVFQKVVLGDYFLNGFLGNNYSLVPIEVFNGNIDNVFSLLLFSFLYVYIDFSAYSNIAIGLARMFGYRISENFNWPLFSTSPRDFWKRWHMSLSNWCMRNIYFPLLIKTKSIFLPAFMVMFVVGMWHSISLSWFFWAIHHSIGIAVSGFLERKLKPFGLVNGKAYFFLRVPMIVCTVIFVAAGFSFAQYSNSDTAIKLYFAYWHSAYHLLVNQF